MSREDAERRWNYVLDGMVTIGKLDQATRENATLVEQSAGAADGLAQRAQQLAQALQVFQRAD